MSLIYMAHPVRPIEGETLAGNIERAEAWLRWCHERCPAWIVIAPWLAELRAYGVSEEGERAQRETGMARQLEVVRRCDGVLLVGGRVSPGMREEARTSLLSGGEVHKVMYSDDPPPLGDFMVLKTLLVRDGEWPEVLR
jgi:hypothetical protein